MTRILLVEKRYDSVELKPLVTAKWIEIPDGEEELFLAKQLKEKNSIFSEYKESLDINLNANTGFEDKPKSKQKLSSDDIVAIFSVVAFVIAIPIAVFLYRLKNHIG